MTIPFLSLTAQHSLLQNEISISISSIIKKNAFILGNELEMFENEYASFTGVNYCIGVGNGLDALTLALMSCHLSAGDEVIVPAHTYLATWLAVARVNARIIPVDANESTFNIDTSKIGERLTKKTKAILPVHLYGHSCDMTMISDLATPLNLYVIEDNAQAHGATWLERRTGSFGHVNGTSFYPTKNLGAMGDGGAVTTNDPDIAAFVRRNRNYGLKEKNVLSNLGINSRLDEIQAGILKIKLKHLDEWNQMRRELARAYIERLTGIGDLVLPLSDKEAMHVYHLFVIRSERRDDLQRYLEEAGIGTLIHYPVPPHLQQAFSDYGFKKGDFPIAERIAKTSLSLPLWPGMKISEVDYVCEHVRRFFS
jgi:dTDP-4-amino-4,6-dideoxygalactose transaminase